MKLKSLSLLLIVLFFAISCSHTKRTTGYSIIASSKGLMKNSQAPFPVFLTDNLINRKDLEKKFSKDVFIVHTGHILKSNLSKAENEKNLELLSSLGINLVNLTLEDFVVADTQGINFENYNQNFLNSSVIDLNQDALATARNINSYELQGPVAFIGLSDDSLDKSLSLEKNKQKYIISDYVLSVLKVKKTAISSNPPDSIHSFIIIHTIGNEINEVMTRLPPSFTNSLAD